MSLHNEDQYQRYCQKDGHDIATMKIRTQLATNNLRICCQAALTSSSQAVKFQHGRVCNTIGKSLVSSGNCKSYVRIPLQKIIFPKRTDIYSYTCVWYEGSLIRGIASGQG